MNIISCKVISYEKLIQNRSLEAEQLCEIRCRYAKLFAKKHFFHIEIVFSHFPP
jgi:hypothetical protein